MIFAGNKMQRYKTGCKIAVFAQTETNVSKRIIFETHKGTNKYQKKHQKHKRAGEGRKAKSVWCKRSSEKKRKNRELKKEKRKISGQDVKY